MIADIIIAAIILGCAAYLFLGFYSSEDESRTGTAIGIGAERLGNFSSGPAAAYLRTMFPRTPKSEDNPPLLPSSLELAGIPLSRNVADA